MNVGRHTLVSVKTLVAELLEGQMQPGRHFLQHGPGRGADPEHDRAERGQALMMVAEIAGLRGAATCAGNPVPVRRRLGVRLVRSGEAVEHRPG